MRRLLAARHRHRIAGALVAFAALALPPATHAYSLLPLATEQAETLPSGVAEGVLGVAYLKDQRFPPFTPPGALRSQQLVAVPQFGFRIGAGGWAEIQASYETLYLDEQAADGKKNWQFGSGDLRMFTKVRLVREGEIFPALGLRFGTKLPDANRKDRLGTDDTDFAADALASKDLGPCTVHVNLGLALLGNSGPLIGNSFAAGGQDDLFEYALGAASAPLGRAVSGAVTVRLLGEIVGQAASHYGNDRSAARFGLQLQRGHGTLYVGASAGLITASENVGASAGFIYTFEPMKLFAAD
jgi:hypothetical protein